MWRHQILPISNRDVLRVELWSADSALTMGQFWQYLAANQTFRDFWIALLKEIPYNGYFWETPPLSNAGLGRAFECVFVRCDVFASLRPDSQPFSSQFKLAGGQAAAVFTNLGGDATLVAPCPTGNHAAYGHLAAFVRHAPNQQVSECWRILAGAVLPRISGTSVWVSTAGLGVNWLHFRIDSRSKYYKYDAYR